MTQESGVCWRERGFSLGGENSPSEAGGLHGVARLPGTPSQLCPHWFGDLDKYFISWYFCVLISKMGCFLVPLLPGLVRITAHGPHSLPDPVPHAFLGQPGRRLLSGEGKIVSLFTSCPTFPARAGVACVLGPGPQSTILG